jgi:hypothetical protein
MTKRSREEVPVGRSRARGRGRGDVGGASLGGEVEVRGQRVRTREAEGSRGDEQQGGRHGGQQRARLGRRSSMENAAIDGAVLGEVAPLVDEEGDGRRATGREVAARGDEGKGGDGVELGLERTERRERRCKDLERKRKEARGGKKPAAGGGLQNAQGAVGGVVRVWLV